MRDIRIEEIAETLDVAREYARGCCLLIGAGCSATAGIPVASGLVDAFAQRWPNRYASIEPKLYPNCMARLARDERHVFIAPFIDRAKVNWAHIAIAQLMKRGYITRILTTNFDPLVLQACAMVGVFPAVYDLASSKVFKPAQVRDPSVFYLHGQRLGFVMLSTDREVREHHTTLAPVFERAGEGRVWIVAGYSGENDPVFEHLASVESFGHNLYWVGYRNEDPPRHVRERLLSDERFAHYVRGYDADSFFVEVARSLNCFPPDLVAKPFSHLKDVTSLLMPFSFGEVADLKAAMHEAIDAAIARFEGGATGENGGQQELETMTSLFSGDYERVITAFNSTPVPSPQLRDAAAWACVEEGNKIGRRARNNVTGDAAARLWDSARQKYALALTIKPGMKRALNSWVISLIEQAMELPPEEREPLFAQAEEKCQEREALVPGSGSYNLACIFSLRGDPGRCRQALLHARQYGFLPKPANLQTDPDLENVRGLSWFAELVAAGDANAVGEAAATPQLPVRDEADQDPLPARARRPRRPAPQKTR